MSPVLSRSLTSASIPSLPYSPLFSSKSQTQNRLSLTSAFLHQNGLKNNTLSCSGLKLKADKRGNSVVARCEASAVAEKEAAPEETSGEKYEYQPEGATIDLKLPRRSLLVHFTCNACGERSQKLINRLAYEKGTVFVECTGCLKYHNLVDNLNLVVEYNYREETIDADEA